VLLEPFVFVSGPMVKSPQVSGGVSIVKSNGSIELDAPLDDALSVRFRDSPVLTKSDSVEYSEHQCGASLRTLVSLHPGLCLREESSPPARAVPQ
jgi:hypothetical protein